MDSSALQYRLQGVAVGVLASTCIFWYLVHTLGRDLEHHDEEHKQEEKQRRKPKSPVRHMDQWRTEEKAATPRLSQDTVSLFHSQYGRSDLPNIVEENPINQHLTNNFPAVTEDHLSLVYSNDVRALTTVKDEYRFLPKELYAQAVRLLPIVCIDLALQRNSDKKFLLVKRGSEPNRGYWWVPGGRMLRNETFFAAGRRKVKEEAGVEARPVKVLGVYNTFFTTSAWGGGTHTVNVGLHMVTDSPEIRLDQTSTAYRWVSAEELVNYDIYVQDLIGAALGEPSCLSRLEAIN